MATTGRSERFDSPERAGVTGERHGVPAAAGGRSQKLGIVEPIGSLYRLSSPVRYKKRFAGRAGRGTFTRPAWHLPDPSANEHAMPQFDIQTVAPKIRKVTFATPPVNVVGADTVAELSQVVDELSRD